MESKPKVLTLDLPVAGLGTLSLNAGARTLGADLRQYSVLFRYAGAEPERAGEAVEVFTFGLFVSRRAGRVRAGFVKRHQILVRA
jgi:hypothetical protein